MTTPATTPPERTKQQQGLYDFLELPSVDEAVARYGASPNKHGPIESVVEGEVWTVQGRFDLMVMGALSRAGFTYMGRTMAIVRTNGEDLTLINPFHLTEERYAEIEKLGTVKNLVRLGNHASDHPLVVKRFNQATYWLVEGMETAKGWDTLGVTCRFLSESAVPVPGAEVLPAPELFVPESLMALPQGPGVLCATDLLQNHGEGMCGHEHASYLMGVMLKAGGFLGKGRVGPAMVQSYSAFGKDGKQILSAWFRDVVFTKRWDTLISGHGKALLNAKAAVKETVGQQFGTTY